MQKSEELLDSGHNVVEQHKLLKKRYLLILGKKILTDFALYAHTKKDQDTNHAFKELTILIQICVKLMHGFRSQDNGYCWGKEYAGREHFWGTNVFFIDLGASDTYMFGL